MRRAARWIPGLALACAAFGACAGAPALPRGAGVLVADLLARGVDDDERLMFVCLQGIANREAPRIYLHLQRSDPVWLGWYEKAYGLEARCLDDPYDLFAAEGWGVEGYVLVDPAEPHSINVAAGFASLENLLPVTERLLAHPELPRLPVKRDLRGLFAGKSPAEVYAWVLERQFPGSDPSVLGSLDVPGPGVGGLVSSHHIRDYVVARRGVFIGLSSDERAHPDEAAVKDRVLASMSDWGRVLGWHMERDGEHDHVRQCSRRRRLALCATTSSNFSFHRHVRNRAPFRQPHAPTPDAVAVEDRIYVSFTYSDGDSLNHFSRGHGYQYFLKERGAVPVGWEVQPLLAELAPGLLEYFYANATPNDTFVASASAVGYVFPHSLPADGLRELLRLSLPWFERIDARSLVVLVDRRERGRATTPEFRALYGEALGRSLTAVFEGYWESAGDPSIESGMPYLITRMPVLWRDRDETLQIIERLRRLAASTAERPLFVPVHVPKSHMDYESLRRIQAALDGRFKIVHPDELALAYRKHRLSR